MSEFIPTEKGVPIRQPSTANLMVDSQNRARKDLSGNINFGTSSDFFITKNNSILNGFFSRIGVTEVVLEWFQPNILPDESSTFAIVESGGSSSGIECFINNANGGFYTVASLVQEMASAMTTASADTGGQNRVYTAIGGDGHAYIDVSGANTFEFVGSLVPGFDGVAERLGFETDTQAKTHYVGDVATNVNGVGWTPDLRLYRYIDFVSNSLTYNQELKDATTAQSIDNILCRWYFAEDDQGNLDEYGFPILQGYTPFVRRRLFSPPKQIKWSAQQPIGQIQFQVQYQPNVSQQNSSALILPTDTRFDFLLTLQVSEV